MGPTRADGIPGVDKIEIQSGVVLPRVVRTLVYVFFNFFFFFSDDADCFTLVVFFFFESKGFESGLGSCSERYAGERGCEAAFR
jgi:hypothetical protein